MTQLSPMTPLAAISPLAATPPVVELRGVSVQLFAHRAGRAPGAGGLQRQRQKHAATRPERPGAALGWLNGLVPPSAGSVQQAPGVRQAMLFLRPAMLRASVLHNVALGLWLNGVPWKLAKEQALQALERVGLADLAARHGKTLSPWRTP